MAQPIISVENLSKRYRLGSIGATSLREEFSRRWDRWRSRKPAGTPSVSSAHGETPHDFWALRDVSFTVQPGEVVGIIGRNGAGKSTLLKILSRITEPTSGRAVLRGRVASLLEVGTGFHPDLTGRENTYLNGAILGMARSEITRRFDEIVAFAEIEQFIDTPVKRYSSGMYVRLAFAVAAHLEPEILIVDEVLAVGDLAFQKKCLGKMQAVAAGEGRTVLFVSHNIDAVRRLCGKAVLLSAGRVKAMDRTAQVLNLYLQDHFAGEPLRVPTPDAHLKEQAYTTSVVLETPDGRPRSVVAVGEAWRVRVGFQTGRPYEKFVVALGLVSVDGSATQTAWSEPMRLEAGRHEAIFEQSVFLQAGTYTLIVGLSNADVGLQQIEAARFDISGENPHGHFPMTSGAGVVLNSMRISVK